MRRFSTILLYVTIAFLLLWQLPWCYNFFVVKPEKTPFTLYSFVIGDFAQMGQEEGKGTVRRDLAGNIYSEAAFDSILPMFYFRQLMSDERFPDTIQGIAVTPKMVQTENFNFRSVPSDINAPSIGLYPLMESMSGRVDLKMPDDVFRITSKGIEFIDMATNSVKEDKSLQFTEAMTKKDFRFPATEIVGNPTVKKEYDEGYLLLDADRRLFHLKQVKGRPYVRAITLPEGLTLEHLYLTEFIPEGTPSHPLQPDVAEREAVPAPSGDRRDRPEQTGADDAPAGEGSGSHRGTESQRSHEVGGADEHLQSPGRGNPDGGAYQQLTLNLFLSEAEQIQSIDEAENVAHTSSAFSFAQNDIDHVLRLGGNTDRQRERVVAAFEKQKTTAEIAEILKTLYHGGNGLGSVSAWYAEDGIHLSHGKSVRYDRSAQVISWESAAERIGELLESGQFASNVELAEAAGYERSLLCGKALASVSRSQ